MDKAIKENDFTCVRDGLTIRGHAYVPQGEALPAVIVSHGFGGRGRDLACYCEAFADWGYAAYYFDFCGGSVDKDGASDGDSLAMTVFTERADLCAVLDYVRAQPYVDKERVVLVGGSQGGFVSALTAAYRPQDVAKLVLMYPAFCIPDDARRGGLAGTSYDVNHVPDIIDNGSMKISRKFHETVVGMEPMKEIAAYPGPVLIQQGTADTIVDYHYALKAQQAYGAHRCELLFIEGAMHAFTEENIRESIASIHKFL